MKRHIIFPLLGLLLGGSWAIASDLLEKGGNTQPQQGTHYFKSSQEPCEPCDEVTQDDCVEDNASNEPCECEVVIAGIATPMDANRQLSNGSCIPLYRPLN